MFDGNRGEIIFQGKFPEDEKHSSILSIYSYWFTQISPEKIIYYSPTHEKLRIYNFKTASVVAESSASFRIDPEFNFFNWIGYYPEEKKCRVLHQSEFSRASVTDIFEDGRVEDIGSVELINGNCMCEHKGTLLYATQANESSPFVIHTLNSSHMSTITFNFSEGITPIEFGFFKDEIIFILYNSNHQPESGIYLIDIGTHDFSSPITVSDISANCQKLVLQGADDPDIFDGRIVVDDANDSILVTGMVSHLRSNL